MMHRLKTISLLPFKGVSATLYVGKRIFALIFWQSMVVILVAGILGLLGFSKVAYSLLLGSLTCIIPTSCFALKFFTQAGARAAQQIVRSFYRAELLKWALTAGMFALVFSFIPVEPVSFFISFIGTQTLFWFVPLLQR